MKGCKGSNSPPLLKLVLQRMGRGEPLPRALCVALFDQASPGPREHGSDTSSRRTKPPLSAVSHPRPAPGDKQWQGWIRAAPPGLGAAAVVGGTLGADTEADWEVH